MKKNFGPIALSILGLLAPIWLGLQWQDAAALSTMLAVDVPASQQAISRTVNENIVTDHAAVTPTPAQHFVVLPYIAKSEEPTSTPVITNPPPPTNTPVISPTATPTPTVTITPSNTALDGKWVGSLSQGTPITFTISMHGLQEIWAEYSFNFGSCIVSGPPAGWWQLHPEPFTGNSFSTTLTSSTSVKGTFDTNTTASGSLTVNINQSGCRGTATNTWTATKQ